MRTKPATIKETVDQLWYAIVGTNGNGMGERLMRVESDLKELSGCVDSAPKKQPKRLEWLTAALGLMIMLQTLGIIEAVRTALWKWVSGGIG
jgi:hypothetical protein